MNAAKSVMLAQKYDEKIDPTGWWMSEKLDGVRAYWSGSKFFSRQGNQFLAPAWFTKDLPKEPLDGELWCGRGLFQKTLSIIKKTVNPEKYADDWKYVTYLVFDAPQRSENGMQYEARVAWMEANILPQSETSYAAVVGVCKCLGKDHLNKMLKQVLMKGGEGIMLRKPKSLYEQTRSHTLLKVKFFHDEEAHVLSHENGSGRCQNMMGKIHCQLPNGVNFKIGTGFSDAQRKKPPKIGSVVSFKYQEMSDNGHPRFPVFLRERGDMTWADVLANAKTKAPFSSMKKKAQPLLQKQHSILFSTIPSRDQDSGKKVVTQNDADDDADEEAKKGLLLTKGSAAHPVAAAAGVGKKRGLATTAKPLCKFHPKCFRKNQQHLDSFDHPPPEGDVDDEDDADDDDEEGGANEPRNKDMPDDPKDKDYEDGPAGKKKKRARTEAGSAAASPAASAAASSSPKVPAAPKACYYGSACYNKDPDHLKRFTHPAPPPPPRTKEEFIETTNQSQHDLAEYYKFGGDAEDDEVAEMLVADKNERRLSIQKFNENKDDREEVPQEEEEEEEQDVKTVIQAVRKAHQKANGDAGYYNACASDDEEEDAADKKTVLTKDLPPAKAKQMVRTPTASSTAATVVPAAAAAAPAASPSPRQPSARVAAAAASSSGSSAAHSAAAAPKPKAGPTCVFLLPELLAKASRIVETEDGEENCKKCGQPVSDHREKR